MARARRRRIGRSPQSGLVVAAILLCGWALLCPQPYALCIFLLGTGALVTLGLPRLTGGYFTLQAKNGDIAASGQVAIAISMIFAIRALSDVDMIDWKGSLLLAAGCGLVFAGLGPAADPGATRSWSTKMAVGIALSFFLAGLGFGWAASVEANMLLDRSEPTIHRLQVTEKWMVRGRATRPHLRLAAPNDLGLDDVHVSDWLYAHAPVGAFVCVESRGGALGFRWYRVATCPEPSS